MKEFKVVLSQAWWGRYDIKPKAFIAVFKAKNSILSFFGIYTKVECKVLNDPTYEGDDFVYNMKVLKEKFYFFGIRYKVVVYDEQERISK